MTVLLRNWDGAADDESSAARRRLERQGLEILSAWLAKRSLEAAAIVDLPAFEFIQKRLVADVQPARRLFAVPARLFEDAKDQLLFGLFCGARSDVFERHVVLFRLNHDWSRIGLTLLFHLGKVHVHFRQDEISLHRVFQLAHIAW